MPQPKKPRPPRPCPLHGWSGEKWVYLGFPDDARHARLMSAEIARAAAAIREATKVKGLTLLKDDERDTIKIIPTKDIGGQEQPEAI